MQRSPWVPILISMLLLATSPASAGTSADPEIRDDNGDSAIFEGAVVNHLEVTKAWIQPKGDDFQFTVELLGMPELINIPKDAVYVFHYSWRDARLYWRANWSADGSTFEYIGGVYAGCKPPTCNSHDLEGNKQYVYLPGNGSLGERLRGEITPGAPGQITWKYPMASYGENREGLAFMGLFVITYQKGSANELRYIDTAQGQSDYEHQIYVPWWSKLVPGPSPLLLAIGLLGLLAVARRHRHP